MANQVVATNRNLCCTPESSALGATHSRLSGGYRLLAAVMGIALALSLLCYLAVSYAHKQPTAKTDSPLELALCDGIPCLYGLVPGRTRWQNADSVYPERSLLLPEGVTIAPSTNGESLGGIFVQLPPAQRISLGAIIGLYGAPCSVSIVPQEDRLELHYPLLEAETYFVNEQLVPDAPVRKLTLRASTLGSSTVQVNPCEIQLINPMSPALQRRWHGFTSLQHYLADSP